ncbi:flagellin [Desulforhabdus sp. TSK]|uniref:flagellin N-terminal helical domain-containing protein n=1 Tax=Desulforhabdus sp. TSK TaxID=2925014 RepID=UPI002087E409|nr:flagellin [Desulforhabdus sp. TSK]GKT07331.1 hypothetical protein DSTSK_06360 [Desulforhabdus sp. TSK]
MALTINSNNMALSAQKNLNKSQASLQKSMERLSSGLRINSAKDDAAGLAISNRMGAKIRGLNQAVRNANDGISLSQTAEGALQETTGILQRIRELSVQASSDSNTDKDRASLQLEVGQLLQEMDRIATSTSYNGKTLFDGTFGKASFQVGSEAGQTISFGLNSAKASALGASGGVASGAYQLAKQDSSKTIGTTGTLAAMTAGDLSINDKNIRGTTSGDDTVSYSDNASSAISIAKAINDSADETGVRAVANATTLTFGTTDATALGDGDFKINGVNIGAVADAGDAAANATALAKAINDQAHLTGVSAVVANTDEITLKAGDGRNITITTGATAVAADFKAVGGNVEIQPDNATAGQKDIVVRGSVSLYSNETFGIAGKNPSVAGLTEQKVTATSEKLLESAAATADTTFSSLSNGDLTLNGFAVDFSSFSAQVTSASTLEKSSDSGTASAMFIAGAINNTDGLKEQITASAKTVMNLGKISSYDASADSLAIRFQGTGDGDTDTGGLSITLDKNIQEGDATGYLVGSLNSAFAGGSEDVKGLVASVNENGELLITADDGRNIRVAVKADKSSTQFLGNFDTSSNNDVMSKGTISLEAREGFVVNDISGGKQALAGIETNIGTVANINISTFKGAQNAIKALDAALGQVDDMRANLGAIQNRFDSTINNLTNVSENLSAAQGRILDADFAAETANMTKFQIMQQAGVAMLAQANQLPQTVLSLLQG